MFVPLPRQFNFDLDDLVGFDLQNVTIGVVGGGKAAAHCAKLFSAFGGKVIGACPDALSGGKPPADGLA